MRRQHEQPADLKYHLVRALGQVLGLGWSQLNLDAISNLPPPTADDIAGLPVMHERDVSNCLPITTSGQRRPTQNG